LLDRSDTSEGGGGRLLRKGVMGKGSGKGERTGIVRNFWERTVQGQRGESLGSRSCRRGRNGRGGTVKTGLIGTKCPDVVGLYSSLDQENNQGEKEEVSITWREDRLLKQKQGLRKKEKNIFDQPCAPKTGR